MDIRVALCGEINGIAVDAITVIGRFVGSLEHLQCSRVEVQSFESQDGNSPDSGTWEDSSIRKISLTGEGLT